MDSAGQFMLDLPPARHPLGSARARRFWSNTEVPAICDRPGNRDVITYVTLVEGVPRRIVEDWFRAMETVGRRSRSKTPTVDTLTAWLDRVEFHARHEPNGDPQAVRAALTRLRQATLRQGGIPTGPEWLAWTTIRDKIQKYSYDRMTIWAEYLEPGDLVRVPGRHVDSAGVHVLHVRRTPAGKVVVTDVNKMTYSLTPETLVRVARPDPTYGAPALQIRDRHNGIIRGVYGCGYQTPPGACGGRCGRPQCDMVTDLTARALRDTSR
jgi:hypothetical protein